MLHHYFTPSRGVIAFIFSQRFSQLFSLWLLLAGSTAASGQTVTGSTPAKNANAAPVTTNVTVTASDAFAGDAPNSIKVFSGQAGGKKAGTATVSGNRLSFNPTANFKPGETVFTTITSASGLTKGHVFEFTTAAALASGTFSGTTNVSVGDQPDDVVAADVDGDGDLDLLTANASSHNVSVRLNNGNGTFSGSTNIGVGHYPSSVAAADVDGDGDLDLLTDGNDKVKVGLNNGAGYFSAIIDVPVGGSPSDVAAADVDGDGDLDILAANGFSTNYVSVRLNNGAGSFGGSTNVTVGNNPSSVAAADVDGDGDLDILVANFGEVNNPGTTVSVRLNNGFGTFNGGTDVAVGNFPTSVAAADVDGDGDSDILTSNKSGSISVRLNNGAGSFSGSTHIMVGGQPDDVAAADVDGDGDLDILVANGMSTNFVGVRLNNGAGSFSPLLI
jgi:hypothetical protein